MKYKKHIILWGMVAILMLGIFYMSAQPAVKSDDMSHKLIGKIAYIIDLQKKHMSPIEQKSIALRYNHITRKITHTTIYFFLSVLSLTALGLHERTRKHSTVLDLTICVLFAISDELHQAFVPGRSAQLTDIVIDFAGVAFAVLIYSSIQKSRKMSGRGEVK